MSPNKSSPPQTHLCRQTPSSAPQPHYAPSGAEGPCTAYISPGGGVAATTLTARPRDSHNAGCWSAGDLGNKGGGGKKNKQKKETKGKGEQSVIEGNIVECVAGNAR